MAKDVDRGGPKASVKPKARKPKARRADVPEPKAPDAFRTIREVAEELDLPQHVLRFWETKFSQVKPLKRGGGRRYYRPQEVELLRHVRDLLYVEGYTIRGVQKLLKEGGAKPSAKGGKHKPGGPTDGGRAPAAPPTSGFSPERRARLEAVMKELRTLRDMLRGRV